MVPSHPPAGGLSRVLAFPGHLLEPVREECESHVRGEQRHDEEVPAGAEGVDDRVLLRAKLKSHTREEPREKGADDEEVVGEDGAKGVDGAIKQ